MTEQHDTDPDVDASSLGEAILWLSEVGVPQKRLSDLFGTTATNIAVIKHRAKLRMGSKPRPVISLHLSAAQANAALGIRDGESFLDEQDGKVDDLSEHLESIFQSNLARNTYFDGLEELNQLRPLIGYPSSIKRRRLLARLLLRRGELWVHTGHCASCIRDAQLSIWLSQSSFDEWNDRDDLLGVASALELMCHAYTMVPDPEAALIAISLSREALEKAGVHPTANFYRLEGVVYLQLHRDEHAEHSFTQSMRALAETTDASPANLFHHGTRHVALLRRDWDGSQEGTATVKQEFGSETMHGTVNTHWCTANGFATASPSVAKSALEMLNANAPTASRFGHQRTIAKLMSITPDLNLPPGLLRTWVRKALYQNAYSHR